MRNVLGAFLLIAGGLGAQEPLQFRVLSQGTLETRLRLAHPKLSERFTRLRSLFDETGCTSLTEQKVKGSKLPNLICSVPSAEPAPRKIVIGAHYDTTGGGNGIIDNWTGAILLPSLAQFMREKPRKHAFEFVGFAAEEEGLLGSYAYVKAIPKGDRQQIAAVITLDSLGLSPTKFWPNGSDLDLARTAFRIALSMKLDFRGVNVDAVGSTDSEPFHNAKIPVLSLHSITQNTLRVINSREDIWRAVSWQDYYDTHRFVSALLTYLDTHLP